jgi:hypothetical protein
MSLLTVDLSIATTLGLIKSGRSVSLIIYPSQVFPFPHFCSDIVTEAGETQKERDRESAEGTTDGMFRAA